MTDDVKTDLKKKPPTQIAGVTGIDGHGAMGEAPVINWFKLVDLPAFEMFVSEQSGLHTKVTVDNWVKDRRATLGDSPFYDQYAAWHAKKGFWPNETPTGELM